MSITTIAKNVQKSIGKHSPEILTGIGIAGMLGAIIVAVRVTPKAVQLIEQEEVEKSLALGEGNESEYEKLTPIETVKTTWKLYVPVAVTSAVSIACLIGASSVNHRRNSVLATAYMLSETALKEYSERVIDIVGEKKEQEVREKIAKDKIVKNPVTNCEVIFTENGETLCYDAVSGRYFKSDIEKIRKAENDLNKRMLDDSYISLNDFYYEIGLSDIKIGYDLGWNIYKGYIDLNFSSQLNSDGTPCLVLDYRVAPRYDYTII
ncbi:hypothetical protein FACS1894132_04810 [Clostridia bacterium]|nr:hypothetical protein FACS1894132_04810 [Clostridia bacterium]